LAFLKPIATGPDGEGRRSPVPGADSRRVAKLMGVSKKHLERYRRGGQEGESEAHHELEGLAETSGDPSRSGGPRSLSQ
jgi:hypothetical protein